MTAYATAQEEGLRKLGQKYDRLTEREVVVQIPYEIHLGWYEGDVGEVQAGGLDPDALNRAEKEALDNYNLDIQHFLAIEIPKTAEEVGLDVATIEAEIFGDVP